MNPSIEYGPGECNGFTANRHHHLSKASRMRAAFNKMRALERFCYANRIPLEW